MVGYTFRDPTLLTVAFTHSSAATKDAPSNEGLAFLGRSICDLLIRDYVYTNFGNNVNKLRSASELEPLLKKCCSDLELNKLLMLSPSAEALRYSAVVEEEVFLALTAAIYKDGGMPSVRAFLLPKLKAVLSEEAPELMRNERRKAVATAGANRAPYSDDASLSERSNSRTSAANALKNLFRSKKKKADEDEDETIPAQEPQPKIEEKNETKNHSENDDKFIVPEKTSPSASGSKRKRDSVSESAKAALRTNAEIADGNYKSALQEYIQKNIRSSTVMLEYKDSKIGSNTVTTVYLFGKKIAEADGASKKEASQNAAEAAYFAIRSGKGEAYLWFSRLKDDPESLIAQSNALVEADYVSQLNHTYQKLFHRSDAPIKYEKLASSAKNSYSVAVYADGRKLGTGEAKTQKEAKQLAAKAALNTLSAESK